MKKLSQAFTVFLLAASLAACSGGGESSSSGSSTSTIPPTSSGGTSTVTPTTPSTGGNTSSISLSGVVSKGPVVNATIDIYSFNADGTRGTFVLGGIVTDASGAWTANIPSTAIAPFMLIAKGGSFIDEYTGATVPLGVVPLRGILAAGATTAPITPITDAAISTIQQMVTDGYASSPANALATVQTNYQNSLGFDPLTVIPPTLGGFAAATAEERQYAAVLGGISTLANDAYTQLTAGGNTPDRMEIIAQMADDFAADGSIDGYGAAAAPLSVNVGGAQQALNGVFAGGGNLGAAIGTYQAHPNAPAEVQTATVTVTPVDFTQTVYVTQTYSISGTISGLASAGTLELRNATGTFLDDLPFPSNGNFTFTATLESGATYNVSAYPPSPIVCNVTNGSGTIANSNITNVSIVCGNIPDTTPPVVTAPADISVPANQTGAINTFLNGATALDAVDGAVSVTHSAALPLAEGTYTITFSATDAVNNTGTATATITITAPAAVGGLTPSIPPIPTGANFPMPTNTMNGIAQLYLDVTAGINTIMNQPAPAGTVTSAGYQSGTLNVTDRYGAYQKTTALGLGADGQPFTADDKIAAYSITNNIVGGGTITFSDPGVDFTWFTVDDNVSKFQSNNTPAIFGNTSIIFFRPILAGTDGVLFTSDDTLDHSSGFAYTIQSLDAAGNAVQVVTINGSGADGQWFTPDDDILSITQASFDASGNNQTLVMTYNAAGPDGLWFTADDTLQDYRSFTLDANGNYLTSLTAKPGVDTYAFTADDKVIGFTHSVYDSYGNASLNVSYNFIGADNMWFTADDIKSATSYTTSPSRTISMTETGPDDAWGTADDIISSYSAKLPDPIISYYTVSYNDPGADGLWFTADDLLAPSYLNFSTVYDVGNQHFTVTHNGSSAAGPDRIVPSADDIASSYTVSNLVSPYQSVYVYNAGADGILFNADDPGSYFDPVTTVSASLSRTSSRGIGADGTWFSVDDPIIKYNEYQYDVSGNIIQYTYYDTYGADSTWYTADDTVSSYSTNTYDASGNQLITTNYTGMGADGLWFTADDEVGSKTSKTYDASNRQTSRLSEYAGTATLYTNTYNSAGGYDVTASYDTPGADGIWNTADDHLSYATYYIIPVIGYPASVAGNTGIPVAGCSASATTGDITVHVKVSREGMPISGATVQLDKAGITQSTLTTDAYGAVTFTAITGTADIHIFKDTYSSESFYCVQPNGAMDMYANLIKPNMFSPGSALRFQPTASAGLDAGRHINLYILDPYTNAILAQGTWNQYNSTYIDMNYLPVPSGGTITGDLWAIEADSAWNAYGVYYDAVLVAANQTYTTVASTYSATPINVSVAFNVPEPAPVLEATVGVTSFPAGFTTSLQARWADAHDMTIVNGQAKTAGNKLPGQQLESIEANGSVYSPIKASFTYNAPISASRPATVNMVTEFASIPSIISQDGLMGANPIITWTAPRQENTNGIIASVISISKSYSSEVWRLHAPVGMGQITLPTVPAAITSVNSTLTNGTVYDMTMDTIARHGEIYQTYVSNVGNGINPRFEAIKRGVTQETHTIRGITFTR